MPLWTYRRYVQLKCGQDNCDWETVPMPTSREDFLENQVKLHLEDQHGYVFQKEDGPLRPIGSI